MFYTDGHQNGQRRAQRGRGANAAGAMELDHVRIRYGHRAHEDHEADNGAPHPLTSPRLLLTTLDDRGFESSYWVAQKILRDRKREEQ